MSILLRCTILILLFVSFCYVVPSCYFSLYHFDTFLCAILILYFVPSCYFPLYHFDTFISTNTSFNVPFQRSIYYLLSTVDTDPFTMLSCALCIISTGILHYYTCPLCSLFNVYSLANSAIRSTSCRRNHASIVVHLLINTLDIEFITDKCLSIMSSIHQRCR